MFRVCSPLVLHQHRVPHQNDHDEGRTLAGQVMMFSLLNISKFLEEKNYFCMCEGLCKYCNIIPFLHTAITLSRALYTALLSHPTGCNTICLFSTLSYIVHSPHLAFLVHPPYYSAIGSFSFTQQANLIQPVH